ncbi:MAG: hypothetical protein NWQ43_01500, partial [Dolichospermum sp.]|nr:hypothetical protein [Dolichospermum sp.]
TPTPRNNTEVTYPNKPTGTAAPPQQATTAPRRKAVIKNTPPQKHRQESTAPRMDVNLPKSEAVFKEEEKVRYYPHPQSETKGLNGWWLVITIVLIMVTGFAAGYLIVRPLLQNQSQPMREIKN